jgi:DNA-binding winged helix-turn-helix (wHTH) protein
LVSEVISGSALVKTKEEKMPPTPHWGFGPFRLDTATACLWREDQLVLLPPKPFAVLAYLVTHAGQVVTKDDLLEAVWPETAISEGVLKTYIGNIRQVLGETARTSRYIATVHGRGYRFLAPVMAIAPSQSDTETAPRVPAGMRAPGSPVLPPVHLVARDTELAQLQQCWSQACQGVRQVVFVTGEAGIGKTTLVAAFIEQISAAEAVWLGHGQCIEQYGAGEAYLPLLAALGQVGRGPDGAHFIELLRQQAPSWLAQLPALLSPAEYEVLQHRSGGTTRDRMLRELAEAVEALTAGRPLLLVLEDLHWGDYATLDWLAYVARRQGPARLLVLGTYRPVEAVMRAHPIRTVTQELQRQRCCTEIILPYLSEAGVAAYLGHRFGALQVPDGLAHMLFQRTYGNPFFLVTLVEELMRHGDLEAVTLGVPESVSQLITTQLARLEPAVQELLTAASVAGMGFAADALAAGLDRALEDVEVCCDGLAHGGQFIQAHGVAAWPDGTVTACYRFIHALYQEVLYERVPVSRRVRWHRQVGLRLEAGYARQTREIAVELAAHFVRGQETGRAMQYLQVAGAQAMQRFAYQEALQHFTQALDLLPILPDTPERAQHELAVRIALGPALMASKGYTAPEVVQTYTRALALCQASGDSPQRFAVLRGLRRVYAGRAEMSQAQAMGEELLALAERGHDPGYLLEAHIGVGTNCLFMGVLASARTHLEAALALYHPEDHRTHTMLYGHEPGVIGLATLSWVLWLAGFPDQAVQRSQAALRLAQQVRHPSSLNFALLWAARLAHYRREVRATQAHAEAAFALAREAGFSLAVATSLRGWALVMQGQGAEGIIQILQGMTTGQGHSEMLSQPYFAALLAEAYLQTGQPAAGLPGLAAALTAVDLHGHSYYAAEHYRLQGELVLQAEVERLEPSTARRTQAAQSPAAWAETCFRQALTVAHRQQAKSWELRATVSLSRLWQQQGQRSAARALLAPITGWFTEGFDTADLQQAKALLEELA